MGPLRITHLHFAATVATSKQPVKERAPGTHRASHHQSFVAGVMSNHLHVPFVLGPGDIPLMMVEDQHRPVFLGLPKPTHNPLAPLLEPNPMRRAAVHIGPRIDRICHYAIDSLINRQFPYDVATLWTVCGIWQRDALLAQPTVNLPDALELCKFLEYQRDGLLYALIRFLLNLVLMRNLAIADGDCAKQLTAFRLKHPGFTNALTKERQLHFAHRSLHAKQKPIVRKPRIIDTVFINNQTIDQTTEFQQRVPVTAVAREP